MINVFFYPIEFQNKLPKNQDNFFLTFYTIIHLYVSNT